MKDKVKSKKIQIGIAVIFGILITLMGGGKFMIYFVIAVLFFFMGKKYSDVWKLYHDWKLAIKVNTVQFSSKQMELLVNENKTLKDEISSANQRLQVYQMTSVKASD
ncbi:hypothetical protein [Paenibacillus sp. SI8]|uniref:hypothetical protein n=1 Tax=unclassified Paenibacillus TaxID=185978 RepID=UPI003467AB22